MADVTANLETEVDRHTEQIPSPIPSTNYSCTACGSVFPDGLAQRAHMKEPWHVNNIKRRVASLPPVPLDEFGPAAEKEMDGFRAPTSRKIRQRRRSSTDGDVSDDGAGHSASPFQCLFCNEDFADDDAGLAANLEHMRETHGLAIPDLDKVVNIQSFVGYLATEIREWHECLYCGATKPSTSSIQSHMRDKGHCHLNLDREPELIEFWESPPSGEASGGHPVPVEQERRTNLSATEMRFASGKVVGSRHAVPARAPQKQSRAIDTLPAASEEAASSSQTVGTQSVSGQQLSRRQQMGLVRVSDQQRQALVLAEKKAQRSETAARRAREWVTAMGANLQKHDQVDTTGKKGKQNHKLWPR